MGTKKEGRGGNISTPQLLKEIGTIVYQRRAHLNLPLVRASQLSGRSMLWIISFEKGRLKNASLQALSDITDAVGLKLDINILNK